MAFLDVLGIVAFLVLSYCAVQLFRLLRADCDLALLSKEMIPSYFVGKCVWVVGASGGSECDCVQCSLYVFHPLLYLLAQHKDKLWIRCIIWTIVTNPTLTLALTLALNVTQGPLFIVLYTKCWLYVVCYSSFGCSHYIQCSYSLVAPYVTTCQHTCTAHHCMCYVLLHLQ